MTDQLLGRLRIESIDSVSLLGSLAESAAVVLGISISDAARLGTLTGEVAEALVRDAYDDETEIDMELDVVRSAGSCRLILRDHGAPMDLGRGGYPPRVSELVRLGFADGLEIAYEPRVGNRAEIAKNLSFASVSSDEEFVAAVESEADTPDAADFDDSGELDLQVRAMAPSDAVGVARLFYRCYHYTAVQAPLVYEPERMAEYVEAGRHFGTIAVTRTGRVVGHVASEIERPDAITGRIGLFAVDPAYRRHHIGSKVGFAHVVRLVERGIVGQFTEAVTVHLASQRSALAAGGHEVGLLLAGQSPRLSFEGFEGTAGRRKSVLLFFASLGAIPGRTVHVPNVYREVIGRIYDECSLEREIRTDFDPRSPADPDGTNLKLTLSHETGVARIRVAAYGHDFLEVLQEQVNQLRLNRFDVIWVYFPLSDPATSKYASGLQELGLSFSGVYPEYRDGDYLVLQCLNNVDIDPADIQVASEMGRYVRDFVVADARRAADREAVQSRSRARMARIYEALDP
ncbi:MAG: GNAT family N-acetyltransferase [Actinobacteria bacterium]|nr:GNAT family N-acetyltransferase [Actinomycetota bacterium]